MLVYQPFTRLYNVQNELCRKQGLGCTLRAVQPMGLPAIPVIFSHLGTYAGNLTCTLLRPDTDALKRIWGPPAGWKGNAVHARPPENLMQGATKSMNPSVLASSTPHVSSSNQRGDRQKSPAQPGFPRIAASGYTKAR